MLSIKPTVYKSYHRADGLYPIKIRITYKRISRYIDTPLTATRNQLSKDLDAIKDIRLCSSVCKITDDMRQLLNDNIGVIKTIDDAVKIICGEKSHIPSVEEYALEEIKKMNETGRKHTGANYRTALQRLLEFAPKVQFQDITVAFLNKYETFLSQKMGQRGVQLYMSCLRRLYNMAIDSFNADGIERIKRSPFEHYSIPTPPETQKRSLTKEQIRLVADFETTDNKVDFARNVFMLSFCLCGINTVDLFTLTGLTDKSVSYNRSKTKSKRTDNAYIEIAINEYSKIYIDKYRNGNKFSFCNLYATAYNFNKAVNKGLKIIGKSIGIDNLQYYCARHSWATIARNECGISVDDIALALCHSKHTVTDIYIKKDFSRIDIANDKVLKLVLQ